MTHLPLPPLKGLRKFKAATRIDSELQPTAEGPPATLLEHLLKGLETGNPSLAFDIRMSLLQLEHLLQGSESHPLKCHREARWRHLSVSVGWWIPTSTTASWQTQLDEAALTLTNPRESLAVLGPCSLALPSKHPVSSVQIRVEPVHTQLSSQLQQGSTD